MPLLVDSINDSDPYINTDKILEIICLCLGISRKHFNILISPFLSAFYNASYSISNLSLFTFSPIFYSLILNYSMFCFAMSKTHSLTFLVSRVKPSFSLASTNIYPRSIVTQ